jgi:FkbM family methyltransferase
MIDDEIWCENESQQGVKVYMNRDYRPCLEWLSKLRNRTVLNLGAHIGWFDWWIAKRWPELERCVSVEPTPSTFKLLEKNCRERLPKSIPIHGGIGGDDGEFMELYLAHTHSAQNTVQPVRGRDAIAVPCVSLERLIREYDPAFVKLDTEGAEYVIDLELFNNVQLITGELHHGRKRWELQQGFVKRMRELGWQAVKAPDPTPQFYNVTNFTYVKGL